MYRERDRGERERERERESWLILHNIPREREIKSRYTRISS